MSDSDANGRYASPPCLAGEIAPTYFDPLGVDPEQWRDVSRWRRSERTRLLAERQTLSVETKTRVSTTISLRLNDLLSKHFDGAKSMVLSAYWPIKGELDLRPLMTTLHDAGVTIALPLVETKAAPLVFRRWTPDTKMVRGDWNIPIPSPDADVLTPDIMLAPVVGWDRNCYRLGYGGGYFDRTLAALAPRPFTIGIGLQAAEMSTIFPQPHDITLEVILTEADLYGSRSLP